MSKAICRCGCTLPDPEGPDQRVTCPECGARVRIRIRNRGGSLPLDQFIRFHCECGRRLKVRVDDGMTQGRCPDCGRVMAIPSDAQGRGGGLDEDTVDLTPEQMAGLKRWSQEQMERRHGPNSDHTPVEAQTYHPPEADRAEVGMRFCPRCKKPVHLGADACQACGQSVPRGSGS